VDQNPRTIVVTGGTAGIGGQLTLSLAQAGFHVLFVGRDPEKGRRLEDRLAADGLSGRFVRGDLSCQAGVGAVAAAVRALAPRGLDGLVNNHGGVFATRQATADGVEATFAANYLHPLLLSCLLLPDLERAAGRVILMGTGYHHLVRWRLGDLKGRRWDAGMNVYGRAKLLLVQAGGVVGRRWERRCVGVHFADPGMAETPLTRSMGDETFPWYGRFLHPLVKRLQHPIPLTWCATSTVRLLARRHLPAPSGVYVLPGPLVLPRPLVGYDDRAGAVGLAFSGRWVVPQYRALFETATGA
jgi:NAD(P)-dependent dehydrogenase (short-subunit alcohol dehydrogenase family)